MMSFRQLGKVSALHRRLRASDEEWHAYDESARKVEEKKDSLLDKIESRLTMSSQEQPLFTIRWRIE